MLQLPQPALQVELQRPIEQLSPPGATLPTLQVRPQAPQFIASVLVFDSQPFDRLPSQSA
jgi:hypothetical protein